MARNKEFIPAERLEKAMEVFWQKGYYATSMKDLVKAMSLNPGSIYGAYGDKLQLFLAGLKMYCDMSENGYRAAGISATSPLAAIKAVIHKAVQRSFIEDRACMVVRSSFELAQTEPEVLKLLKAHNLVLVSILSDWITEAQAEGAISGTKDPRTMAAFITANFAGIWQLQLIHHDRKLLDAMEKTLTDTLFST
ncbi:TetR/AcrR family transcriptional regulator [Chitinophaga flava]|uniref:TetR/AcrR family transcriptional regulator n=1 Tax=Chitinophaga flava TaxID=2259036 RepID=A0A365XRN6_9BACT|nr:TetR/AcrR family transcriptional regulator [Chitinophaga flava]RBL88798.1 TetR/AcrR family transcriptional regulator [Chitinophaga flava]